MEGSMVSGSRHHFGVVALAAAALALLVGWPHPSSAECPTIEYVRVCNRSAEVGWRYDEGGHPDFGGYRIWTCHRKNCIAAQDMVLSYEFVFGDDDPQSPTYWPFEAYVPGVVRTVTIADSIVTLTTPPDTIPIQVGSPFRVLVTAFSVGETGLDETCLDTDHISRNIYTGPKIVFARVGDKSAAVGWTMGVSEQDIKDNAGAVVFGGYRIWMREVWESEEFSLVREYILGEDNPLAPGYWPFDPYYLEPVRADSGDFFQNAFPYQFSVTAFSAINPDTVNAACRLANAQEIGTVYPNVGVKKNLAFVQAIPNPYRSSADWEYGGQRRVTFVGLPAGSTVRIYTVSADHVVTLYPENQRDDQHDWDLRNKDGEEVAPGVYLWQVDAPTYRDESGELVQEGGIAYGRLMIIK
jgi:hypothetical protein